MEEEEIGFPPVARVNICRRVDECLSIGSCDCGISLWQTERGFYGLLLFMGCLARRVKTGLLPGRQKKRLYFFSGFSLYSPVIAGWESNKTKEALLKS